MVLQIINKTTRLQVSLLLSPVCRLTISNAIWQVRISCYLDPPDTTFTNTSSALTFKALKTIPGLYQTQTKAVPVKVSIKKNVVKTISCNSATYFLKQFKSNLLVYVLKVRSKPLWKLLTTVQFQKRLVFTLLFYETVTTLGFSSNIFGCKHNHERKSKDQRY